MKRMRGGASFLTRLARDARGNTLAIVAAAMLPMAGLIGGGVDMSRLYLTKTRLQQACDAGALAGRKAMATNAWTTGTTGTEGRAKQLFTANFKSGAYGTSPTTPTFSEHEGTVTGTATVAVPMTIMRIFGMTTRNLTVTCTAKMEIPNTDVMFVLDVTNSMSGSRITGLKSAVKCFYEALVKVGTPQTCDAGGNPAKDPQATEYTGTAQIRLGFVPYAVNVNVGKLLPHDYIADSWEYQSRRPTSTPTLVHAWTVGIETAVSDWGAWTGTAPDSFSDDTGYNSFSTYTGSAPTLADGKTYPLSATANSTTCDALNAYGTQDDILGIQESGTPGTPGTASYTPTNNNPPVYSTTPPTTQNLSASRTRPITVTYGFRYRWFKKSGTDGCYLERASKKTSGGADKYNQTQTGTSSRPINWTDYQQITGWTNGKTSLNVSALKKPGTTDEWLGSITLPLDETNPSVKLSGSNSSAPIKALVNRTVVWDGCIEERQTFKNMDGTPSDDWDPIPSEAFDLDIDLIPDKDVPGTQWGPMLPGALQVTNSPFCPTPARKLTEYKTSADLVSYINSLTVPSLGTYHDIGMIWGARLLSPTGIFAKENAETSKGGAIQRHLIFMTDGKAQTVKNNYGAYGLTCIDLRQFNSCPSSDSVVDSLVNARLTALCERIKKMNITLWVISYGGGVDDDDEERLATCATPPSTGPNSHFYSADDGPALIARFKQIASEIADLRLTS